MVTIFKKRALLTDYQLQFLVPYILHKRKNEQSLKERSGSEKKLDENMKECEGSSTSDSVQGTENVTVKLSEDVDKSTAKYKQSESDSPVNIAEQIKVLQERLESLKKEKHSLFQQLKLVLHHEDEKKKQEDQKLELEKNVPPVESNVEVYDPRQQIGLGLKRPYSSFLSSSYPGASPLKRQSRGPLLPTPEGSSPAHFSRQNSGSSYHGIQESFHQGGKPIYSPRTPSAQPSSRPPYLEHRMGSSYNIPPDVHMQGPHPGSLDSPLINRTSQPSGTFVQPEMQPQYQGIGVANFQYTPNPSPYGSMTNIHGPSGPSQPVQLQYSQGGSFVQQHEVHPYNQPMPHDLPIKGHPMYSQMGGQSGHQPTEHIPTGSFPAPLHDPRHQKLVSGEHMQSPHYSS